MKIDKNSSKSQNHNVFLEKINIWRQKTEFRRSKSARTLLFVQKMNFAAPQMTILDHFGAPKSARTLLFIAQINFWSVSNACQPWSVACPLRIIRNGVATDGARGTVANDSQRMVAWEPWDDLFGAPKVLERYYLLWKMHFGSFWCPF